MKITVYVLSTCLPGDPEPCWPGVFLTAEEADKAFKEAMEHEWETADIEDDDGNALPFPDDADVAHDQLKAYWLEHGSEPWGQYEITPHTIEIPILGKLVTMLDRIHLKMEAEGAASSREVGQDECDLFNEIGCLIAEAKGEYNPEAA